MALGRRVSRANNKETERGKVLREWLVAFLGLIGAVLGLLGFQQSQRSLRLAEESNRQAAESSRQAAGARWSEQRIEVGQLLDAAWDNLGGKEGSGVIVDFTNDTGKLELARRNIERAIVINPNLPRIYRVKGVYLYAVGKYKEAEEAYRRAISMDSEFAPTYVNLGNLLFRLKRRQEALEAFNTAKRLDPDDGILYLNLGAVYREMGLQAEADEALADGQRLLINRRGVFSGDTVSTLASLEEDLLTEPMGTDMSTPPEQ